MSSNFTYNKVNFGVEVAYLNKVFQRVRFQG